MRQRILAQLPPGAFLRRDRGEALYVTNAPLKGWEGQLEGFTVEISGGIAKLSPDIAAMEAFTAAPDALATELKRFGGAARQQLPMFIQCLKCLEAPDEKDLAKCDKALRQRAAVALRSGGGEGLYQCALVLAEVRRELNIF